MNIGDHLMQLKHGSKKEAAEKDESADSIRDEVSSESSLALMRSLTGPVTDVTDFFFPADVVGGVCPRVAGKEEEIVWNAAAEACDSERVHVVWQSAGNTIWYLAVKSADLASNPSSWCPLAALLPKPSELASLPICYTYFGDELAVLMVVTADELHIFRGTAAVIKAKAERIMREHGEKAHIVNIDLFRIGQMAPVPWYSATLFEDRARRILSALSVVTALGVICLSIFVWLTASMAMISASRDYTEARERTERKTVKLLEEAEQTRSSPLREQIKSFLDVNDGLLAINGVLSVYSLKDKDVRWRAVVPPSTTADRISAMGGTNIETTDKGVAIGNQAEKEYEEQMKAKGK